MFVGYGAVLVTLLPIGTDPSRQRWLDGGLLIGGGTIILLGSVGNRHRSSLPLSEAILALELMSIGVVSSTIVRYAYPGGDAFHMHLGFPLRWIIGDQIGRTGTETIEWSLYWPGLYVDCVWWLTLALAGLMLMRYAAHWRMRGHSSGLGNPRQARG